jgi:thioredoxin-related protein
MQLIKNTLVLCAALVAFNVSAFAGGEGWSSDFAAAQKQAAESNKDLLIDFTGSDWCGWCIKLNNEVFKLDPFKAGVKDSFVLVEVDFPKDKAKLSEATQKQNSELAKKYAVAGFPTIMLSDAAGRPYAVTGYAPGGPEKYVSLLQELRAKKAKRDEAFAAAAKAEGLAKAKLLIEGLNAMELDDALVANLYGDVVANIRLLDKDDTTGYAKAKAAAAAKKAAAIQMEKDVNQFFNTKIKPLKQANDLTKALLEVKAYIKEHTNLPEQYMVGMLLDIGFSGLMDKKNSQTALSFVDDVAKECPTSEFAKNDDSRVNVLLVVAVEGPKNSQVTMSFVDAVAKHYPNSELAKNLDKFKEKINGQLNSSP